MYLVYTLKCQRAVSNIYGLRNLKKNVWSQLPVYQIENSKVRGQTSGISFGSALFVNSTIFSFAAFEVFPVPSGRLVPK